MPRVLQFPNIDPVLVSVHVLGCELAIRWYALAYIAGRVLGWRYVVALVRRPGLWGGAGAPMRPEQVDVALRTGGSSRIPRFVRMLRQRFGEGRLQAMDTFTSVGAGLGLAAYAANPSA